ncbi:MAG: hypothetical protein BGO29_14855 [Bacteroidales bacterium 36-12]|nr:MAG: hypothetical protein BGO29_14855 [Bacteroidales bacterium 36-12]
MAAPKGNQFWKLRSKHGRDKLFNSPGLLWRVACEYFQWCDDNPFYEVEQVKSTVKPYKDKDTGEVIFPNQFVELPKMRPYTLQGLCLYIGCNVKYFNDFDKQLENKEDEASKDFSEIVTRIRETIYNQKFSGAASGFLNPNIIARDLGLSDRQELTGKDGGEIVLKQITGMVVK